jgi:hypothetical protein
MAAESPVAQAGTGLRASAIRKAKTTNDCAADQKPGERLYASDLEDDEWTVDRQIRLLPSDKDVLLFIVAVGLHRTPL